MVHGSHILAVTLLSPGFALAGVLLAALPIIIHILNRRRFKTVSWAAMEFLLRAMRKNRRRLRFEQWLLLAVRCMALMLLGLALARPMGCGGGALAALGRRSELDVIVIDTSYSMGYAVNRQGAVTHLDEAKNIAKALLSRGDSGGVAVAVITAGRPAVALFARPTYDLQSALSAVERIGQTFGATDLAGALDAAMKIGRDPANPPERNLFIITDGTRSAVEGAQAASLAQLGPQLAQLFRVTLFNLGEGKPQWNGAVTSLEPASNLVTDKFPTDFKATLRGFGVPASAAVQWKLDDQPLDSPAPFKLDGSADLIQTHAHFETGGPHVLSARLINDDPLQVDNTFWRVVQVTSALKTLIVEGKHGVNPLEGSGAFLRLALAPPKDAKGDTDSYVEPEVISDLELGNKALAEYSAVIIAGVGQISPEEADRLRDFVQQGGTLLVFMGDPVDKENYNAVLLPRKLLPGPLVKLVSVGTDQRGILFDFKPENVGNRLLSAFAHQPESGLDTAQVFTYWQADPMPALNVETVLRYLPPEGSAPGRVGDAAITSQTLGQGRVVFVSTSANPDWTNLPAKLAYVPLIHELLSGSVRSGDWWMNLTVDQRLVIPPNVALAGVPTLSDPSARPIDLIGPNTKSTDPIEQTYHSQPLPKPGVYMLSLGDRQVPIAVNVPAAEEADVFTLTDAALRKALGGINLTMLGADMPAEAAVSTSGNDFGWWCMALLLGVVGLESFLAMSFGHYRRSQTGSVVATN
jgi:hypothetical protein